MAKVSSEIDNKKDTKPIKKWEYREYGTKEQWVQNILGALRNGLHRDSACAVSKVPRRSFYDRMADDEDFRTKVEDAEEYWMSIVENKKKEKIDEWYRPAIEKELKSKRRNVYWDKLDVDQNVIQATIDYDKRKDATPAEIEEMRKKLIG